MPTFFFHYNKPASKHVGQPVMSVHYKGQCLLVRDVVCSVPVRSRHRSRQPHVVMAGRGSVRLDGDTAYIEKETDHAIC